MSNDESAARKDQPPRWMIFGFAAFGVAGVAGLAVLVTRAYRMVTGGRGTETYRTFWGVEFNWISVLVFVAAAVIAILVAMVFRWREGREWRALERKYGRRDEA
jgi:hypothetical protein